MELQPETIHLVRPQEYFQYVGCGSCLRCPCVDIMFGSCYLKSQNTLHIEHRLDYDTVFPCPYAVSDWFRIEFLLHQQSLEALGLQIGSVLQKFSVHETLHYPVEHYFTACDDFAEKVEFLRVLWRDKVIAFIEVPDFPDEKTSRWLSVWMEFLDAPFRRKNEKNAEIVRTGAEPVEETGAKVSKEEKHVLRDSVGQNGANKPEDVKLVKDKLKELEYPVKDGSDKIDADDIKAIKFFQVQHMEINQGEQRVDGKIDKGGKTESFLFSKNPEHYKPMKNGSVKSLSKGVETDKKNATEGKNEALKAIWKHIIDVWNEVSPYFPEGTVLFSGYRSKDEQRAIMYSRFLQDSFKPAYKKTIDPKNNINADKLYEEYCNNIKDAKSSKLTDSQKDDLDDKLYPLVNSVNGPVAKPGGSKHQSGKAIDTQKGDASSRVKALLWYSIKYPDKHFVTKIINEPNGCVHFEFE